MNYLRIKKNTEFQKHFNQGKRSFSSSLTVLYLKAPKLRMGICVSKKNGTGVKRNRIKRLIREAFRIHATEIKQEYSFIFIPKVKDNYSMRDFEKDILYILRKEKLLKKNETQKK